MRGIYGGAIGFVLVAIACGDFGPSAFRGNARRLLTGESTACAIARDGKVWCWGTNTTRWELGAPPSALGRSPIPVRVPVPHLASFATGVSSHFCGITPESRAVCWGRGGFGQLGTGVPGDSGNAAGVVRSGVRWTDLSVGRLNTCGRSDTGRGLCWGANQHGEIGISFISIGLSTESPVEVDGGHRFKQIAPGWIHSCGITDDDRLFCWGSNEGGQLGVGFTDTDERSPVPVAPDLRFAQIALGAQHTCALTVDGVAYCWGTNFTGQLGDGTTVTRAIPTLVFTSLRFTRIATSSGFAGGSEVVPPSTAPGQVAHTCALTSAGALYCWGWNGSGQLGDGTTFDRLTPVAVSGAHTFDTIGLGGAYSCGMQGDNAWCWGANAFGQLGTSLITGASSPVPLPVSANFGAAP